MIFSRELMLLVLIASWYDDIHSVLDTCYKDPILMVFSRELMVLVFITSQHSVIHSVFDTCNEDPVLMIFSRELMSLVLIASQHSLIHSLYDNCYEDPVLMIFSRELMLLVLMASRHDDITWVLCLPTVRKTWQQRNDGQWYIFSLQDKLSLPEVMGAEETFCSMLQVVQTCTAYPVAAWIKQVQRKYKREQTFFKRLSKWSFNKRILKKNK